VIRTQVDGDKPAQETTPMPQIEVATPLPVDQIVHADWSVNPKRRWLVRIERLEDGWNVHAPELVGDLSTLLDRIKAQTHCGKSLLGLDLPIGAPSFWAEKAQVKEFLPWLRALGISPWEDFYNPAFTTAEIGPHRPFYPARPGGTKQAHLVQGLGASSMDDLCRKVDFNAEGKRAATPLFWTLGAAQVGKAALSFWREVLQPALLAPSPPAVWPFEGKLSDLISQNSMTICETYPAEVYEWFGLDVRLSGKAKTNQQHRAEDADALLAAGLKLGALFQPEAQTVIMQGFPMGDDAFDAMVGALGMLQVVQGIRAPGTPDDPKVHAVEGWILGRRAGATETG
jgi:hypothetical protein